MQIYHQYSAANLDHFGRVVFVYTISRLHCFVRE